MKKALVCLAALTSVIACKKECDDPVTPDPEIIRDTVYITNPPACTPELNKGLLAYYPFNGNFNDESGNGLNGTAQNGTMLATDMVGRANKAVGFDGVNDYVIVPANAKLNAETFTISVQVMVTNTGRRNAVITRGNFNDASAVFYGINQSSAVDNKWAFGVLPGTQDCASTAGAAPEIYATATSSIEANRWYNVVTSFSNGVEKVYIDGVLQTTKTLNFTKPKTCATADLIIGGWWKNDIISLSGKIDEVRLYNRLLSDCEIAKLAEGFKE